MERENSYCYGAARPSEVRVRRVMGMPVHTVCCGISEVEADDAGAPPDAAWRWREVEMAPGEWTYDALVDAIIRLDYPTDRMLAVINNYQLDPANEATTAEWRAMQQARAAAKETARRALAACPD